jgi:hypothetical protein
MLDNSVITFIYTTSNNRLWRTFIDQLEGESMKLCFDGGIKLESHGTKVTSDGGLLAYRDLDDALGLFYSDRSLLAKLTKIGAKVFRHSGYVTFQMAEVAIDRGLFAETLARIEQLR